MNETPVDEPILSVRGLFKSYGGHEVLRGIDLDLGSGECLVILGGSGSGKSVLLRQLNGLESPDRGQVLFRGRDLAPLLERELFPIRRKIAMLFQSGALFDSMTVAENIAFPLREHTDLSDDEIGETVRRKLDMVRLGDIERKLPADLSGGMRKRVALARSLALDPEIMLYDEPTTGLDPRTSATIALLVERTGEEAGVSSIVVTHDLPLARAVGDRVAFLHRGRFRFFGDWDAADASDDPELRPFLDGTPEVTDVL